MTKNLFPVFEMPSKLAEEIEQQNKYKIAPLFDLKSGEFVLNGARQPIYGTGYDAWKLWCIKAIMTQRWAYYAYSSNSGIEAQEAFKKPDRGYQESAFERTITEALLADPLGRTQQVRNFQFNWGDDSLEISCEIVGSDGNSGVIEAWHGDSFKTSYEEADPDDIYNIADDAFKKFNANSSTYNNLTI